MKKTFSILFVLIMIALPLRTLGAVERTDEPFISNGRGMPDGPVDGLPWEAEIEAEGRQYEGGFDSNACIILMDAETGVVLFEQNPDRRAYPASTTKVLSTLMAFESGELDRLYTVGSEVELAGNWSTMTPALQVGETISLRDMIYGAMLPSGCEASAAIGVALGGSTEAFVDWMNRRAASLGMNSSHFLNANGISDTDHYSTAADMCRLVRAAINNPGLMQAAATHTYVTAPTNMCGERTLTNTNYLIDHSHAYYYPYAKGVKTGTSNMGRFCLTACAEKEGKKLILVILRAPTDAARYQYAHSLFDWGFENVSNDGTELFFNSCAEENKMVSVPLGTRYYYAPEADEEYALGSAAAGRVFLIKYSAYDPAGELWYFTSEGYFIHADNTAPYESTVSFGYCADDCHPLPQGDIRGGGSFALYGTVYADAYINYVEASILDGQGREAASRCAEIYDTCFDLSELGALVPTGALAPGGYVLRVACRSGESEYSFETEFKVISALAGDADGDGSLSFTDVAQIYLFLIGDGEIDTALIENADFNGDGRVDFVDIAELNLALIG